MSRRDLSCARCSNVMWRSSTSLPDGRAVCRPCRREKPQPYKHEARVNTECPVCGSVFLPAFSSTGQMVRTCSRSCGDAYRKRPEAAVPCDDCGRLTTRGKTQFGRVCDQCAQDRRRASYRMKNHTRRSAERFTDITPELEAQLRRRARRCPLCLTRMTDAPYSPNSKHLDHIIPIVLHGTHTIGNVRIICQTCNLGRPKDGSDLDGFQPTLWAQDPVFVETLSVRTMRPKPLCVCWQPVRKGRCWGCQPPRGRDRSVDGRRAAEMRAHGMKWQDIASALAMENTGAVYGAARQHGDPDVIAQWPGRYKRAA